MHSSKYIKEAVWYQRSRSFFDSAQGNSQFKILTCSFFSETIGETIFNTKGYRSKKLNLLFIEWGHMIKNTAVLLYIVETL